MIIDQLNSHFIPSINKGHSDGGKLMIVLHGLGDSLESYKVFAQELNLTGLGYLLLNAPTPYFFGHSWYDIPPGNPQPGIENSSNILVNVINSIIDQGYKYEDIFLCGFSQGGCIALETMYKLDTSLAGVIALSPRIYHENIPADMKQANKIFMAHGKYDPVINFQETYEGYKRIKSLGHDIIFKSYNMEHQIDYQEIIDLRQWLNEEL